MDWGIVASVVVANVLVILGILMLIGFMVLLIGRSIKKKAQVKTSTSESPTGKTPAGIEQPEVIRSSH
jgi:hypothetical protein